MAGLLVIFGEDVSSRATFTSIEDIYNSVYSLQYALFFTLFDRLLLFPFPIRRVCIDASEPYCFCFFLYTLFIIYP